VTCGIMAHPLMDFFCVLMGLVWCAPSWHTHFESLLFRHDGFGVMCAIMAHTLR
jgi:hypothetical protein